ncbi:unnamed protein product [Arabidopsis arenosa]|uniref:Uncharacterized protein n=1 Tax=Arabidopsis arenosa TaxID=38785 RepID=A0A8S1ZF02_ARAAE|nr:unnamed protein product [Arabidopsis arenosa]
MPIFYTGKDDLAVANLLSQAKDHYVLEQVAKINCSGFTDDSALPSNLETRSRLRRLKSLPVSRSDSVASSSKKKLLSLSKTLASYPKKKSCGNGSSVSSFSSFSGNRTGNSCPLDSSVGIKRDTSVYSRFEKNSRGEFGDFSDSGRIGYSSSKRMNPKFLTPATQTLKLRPKENSRTSSSTLTSIDSASPSSYLDQKEKSKSRFLRSWFDKLPLAQAMGCLQGKSSSKSKKTKESCTEEFSWEEEFKKAKKRVEEESKQMKIMLKTRQNVKDCEV